MAENKTGITASLFKNTKRSADNHPEFQGPGRISRSTLVEINQAFKDRAAMDDRIGEKCLDLRIAGWRKMGTNGQYIFCVITPDRPQSKEGDDSDDFDLDSGPDRSPGHDQGDDLGDI